MPRTLPTLTLGLAALAALSAFSASAEDAPQTARPEAAEPARTSAFPVFSPYPEPAYLEQPAAPPEGGSSHGPAPDHATEPGSAAPAPGIIAAPAVEPGVETDISEARDAAMAAAAAVSPAQAGASADSDAAASATDGDFAISADFAGLEPYKLMRSLQFVQDAVVRGDHSAMEMQRFLLGVIDSRLRQADQKVFDDPRNVDAALIYAMSGGNPETLEILALRDKFGNFDNEITTVLRAYLNGRAAKTQTTLEDVVKIYRDTEIGPYLTLVAANVTAAMNDLSALNLFDWARLTAPGTLVEEAALRRSLFISARKNLVDEALQYAQLYARRFINSPYAGQYADLLVDLVVLNYGKVGEERLSAILSFMDRPRKREVYLRIARKAVISGLRDLAVFAAEKAEGLLDETDPRPQVLVDLYSGMARIPTDGVDAVLTDLEQVSARQLSRRDRALRAAARIVAAEVLRKPDPNSLTQAFSPMVNQPNAVDVQRAAAPAVNTETLAKRMDLKQFAAPKEETDDVSDEAFKGYVSDRRKTLDRIDEMLEGVAEEEGS